MTAPTYTTDIEFSTEDGQGHPTALLLDVSLNDDAEAITFKGPAPYYRVFRHHAAVGSYRIPLSQMGFDLGATLTVESVKAALFVQVGSTARAALDTPIAAVLPSKPVVTTNFTLGDWADGAMAFDETGSPVSSPDTVAKYILADDAYGWVHEVAVGDLPADVPITPETLPNWPEGVATFDMDITVAAAIDDTRIGPASNAVEKTITLTDLYYLDNADWTATSVQDEGSVGHIDIEIDSGSSFVLQAPWDELWCYAGPVPSGTSSSTLLPSDWFSTTNQQIQQIEVGDTVRIQSGVAVDGTAYSVIFMRRSDTGDTLIISARKTTTVLALSVSPPTVVNAPAIVSGLVSHDGVLKANVGVQLTGGMGAADWSGEDSFTNQFRVSPGVGFGSVASNALATATPTSAEIGKQIWVRSNALAGEAPAQAISALYDVVDVAPSVAGTVPNVSFLTTAGAQTVSAANVAAAFSGLRLTYSVQSTIDGVTINSSTGEVSIPAQSAAVSGTYTVTASNTGGIATSAAGAITATVPADDFTFNIAANQWTAVEAPESDGQAEGTIKFTLGGITVSDGYGMRISASKDAVGAATVAATMAASPNATTFFTKTAFAVGDTVKCTIYRRKFGPPEEWREANVVTITIQGHDTDNPPGTWAAPAAAILSNANGRAGEKFNTTEAAITVGGHYGGVHMALAYAAWRGDASWDNKLVSVITGQLSGNTCPPCRAGYSNQLELQNGVALYVMAKLTPRLWANFSSTEQQKMDALVRAIGVASAWSTADKRMQNAGTSGWVSKVTKMDGTKNNYPRGNPNYQMACPFAVSLLAVWLGDGAAADAYLNSGPFNDVATKVSNLGLTNVSNGAFKSSRPSGAPSATEVNNACSQWRFKTRAITDLAGILAEQLGSNWDKPCIWIHPQSSNMNNRGRISNSNPTTALAAMNGRIGMPSEINSGDGGGAGGVRSSATYAYMSVRMSWCWMIPMFASGLVARNSAAIRNVKAQMRVGWDWYEEMMKNNGGWLGWDKGSQSQLFDYAGDNNGYAYDVHMPMLDLAINMIGD